jgi:hypothetical protein
MKRAKQAPPFKRTRARWEGGCFQKAAALMLRFGPEAPARLCHGKVRDSFHPCRWVDHAWVEVPAVADVTDDDGGNPRTIPIVAVCDDSQPEPKARRLPWSIFEAQTQVRDVRRYTFSEMMARAVQYRSDGPWL